MHVGYSYGYGALHAISHDIRPPTPPGWTLYESDTVPKAPKNRPEPSWGSSVASPNQAEWNTEPLAQRSESNIRHHTSAHQVGNLGFQCSTHMEFMVSQVAN
ncbi:hypothetical protein JMJ77_0002267 [Colletotrichum scovillei]|uniref:Uncharacterized protein n=1 Tax=Colletotrichum scovillei TaxID=1209932 RepID=A0A9P7UD45_9PEZI|nr:hypothetical protein JMJ77_0002267 [Colletotrichum scovillei]KAG7070686.1 hypothetical protein JMJ76_0001933 [Colletotrichum scovillei]KAG7078927.1 hypothetical protein JMJ78_0002590 [Colletotrichum scovillei]